MRVDLSSCTHAYVAYISGNAWSRFCGIGSPRKEEDEEEGGEEEEIEGRRCTSGFVTIAYKGAFSLISFHARASASGKGARSRRAIERRGLMHRCDSTVRQHGLAASESQIAISANLEGCAR